MAPTKRLVHMISDFLSRFTPGAMSVEALESLFVQRQALLQRLLALITESCLTGNKHHALLIGPRGIGKSHLVSLLYYRLQSLPIDQESGRLMVGWLREEEWGIASFLDL